MDSYVSESDWQILRKRAEEAREHAYAPYSDFSVGAALLTDRGEIFSGCNVENASYGLTICAERNAIFAAAAGSETPLRILGIYIDAPPPAPPCGACRQVLAEFGGQALVSFPGKSDRVTMPLSDLLPHSFDLEP